MLILAIDPGTRCGYAMGHEQFIAASGVWDLGARRHEGGGMRFLRLRRYLREILDEGVQAVVYEEVHRHNGTAAAHVYGGIVAHIAELCEARGVPYRGYGVGAIKKHATGKGNAPKERMLDTARQRWPSIEIPDDNAADALWLLDLAQEELG